MYSTTVGEHVAVAMGPCAWAVATCKPSVGRALQLGPLALLVSRCSIPPGGDVDGQLARPRSSPLAGEEYAPEDEGSVCVLLSIGKGYCPE